MTCKHETASRAREGAELVCLHCGKAVYTDHDRAMLDGLLRAHTPSLTERAEEMIETAELEGIRTDGWSDPADAAYRECSCGVMLDGFYAYIAHLREVTSA